MRARTPLLSRLGLLDCLAAMSWPPFPPHRPPPTPEPTPHFLAPPSPRLLSGAGHAAAGQPPGARLRRRPPHHLSPAHAPRRRLGREPFAPRPQRPALPAPACLPACAAAAGFQRVLCWGAGRSLVRTKRVRSDPRALPTHPPSHPPTRVTQVSLAPPFAVDDANFKKLVVRAFFLPASLVPLSPPSSAPPSPPPHPSPPTLPAPPPHPPPPHPYAPPNRRRPSSESPCLTPG